MVPLDRQEEGEARTEKVDHLSRRNGRIRQEIDRLKAMTRPWLMRRTANLPDGPRRPLECNQSAA